MADFICMRYVNKKLISNWSYRMYNDLLIGISCWDGSMYSFVEKHYCNPVFIDMYASVKVESFLVSFFLFNLFVCIYVHVYELFRLQN